MRKGVLFGVAMLLAVGATANASIIGWNCSDDGDGAIVMNDNATTWSEVGGEYHLAMTGKQYSYPAHVEGDFLTDTDLDPTVWIVETVDNYTNFTWTDYHIAIGMNKPFLIVGAVAPLDWTWQVTAPQGGLQMPNQPPGTLGTVGYVDFFAGTPIAPTQSGTFGVVVSFLGSVQFCTEQIPTPEPATMVLLAIGGLLMRRSRR